MKFKRNEIIGDRYKVKNFIEDSLFCQIYSALEMSSSNLVSLYVYNSSNISKDDLDETNNLKEIGFLGLGIEGFPKLIGYGDFNYNNERFRYIATEFIVGESVMDRMKRSGPIFEVEATIVCTKLVEIAEKLHSREKSILLNAVSLDNIMFDMSGSSEEVKLRNLINVRYFDDEFKFSYIDGVIPNYLAPECFNDVFTSKSDQYNLAALLFHMISGLPPWFSEPHYIEINTEAIKKLETTRSKPLKFDDSFDNHFKSIVSKALSHNVEERFVSLQNFLSYLNRETILSNSGKGVSVKNIQKPVKSGNGFADVAGMDNLKTLLKTELLEPLDNPERAKKYGITVPNGMLLYGPPGCGKTFIAKKFGEEAGYNFYLMKPSDLSSIYVSGGEQKIGEVFELAENNSPSIICFDEIDAVMPQRDSSNQHLNSRVNEYLAQIDKCSERGIFVIGTTNRVNLIDEAVLRTGRLDHKVFVPPPDESAREKMFELYLKNRFKEHDIDYRLLSELSIGITASDVEFIVNQASHKAARLDVRISNENLKQVISSFTPSISKEEFEKYSKDHKEYKQDNSSDGSIGFKRNRN
jgi:transitional endoplasmic reticulum ATPase